MAVGDDGDTCLPALADSLQLSALTETLAAVVFVCFVLFEIGFCYVFQAGSELTM